VKPIRGGLLLAVAAAVLLICPAASWGAYPGANGLIAYDEPRGDLPDCNYATMNNEEIFTISPAGGEPTQLTDNAAPDLYPSWSPDGRRLVFTRMFCQGSESASAHQTARVFTMRANGEHQRRITQGRADEALASFSPGGRRVVLVHNGHIAIVRTDGTVVRRLTTGQKATEPAFSPDGRRIVFRKLSWKGHTGEIWVMRRDGTHKRLLARAHAFAVDIESPDYSPDGSHIVFSRCHFEGHSCTTDDVLMRSDGSHKRFRGGGFEPAFSPNGRRIAAVVQACGLEACTWSLDSFAIGSSDARTVTLSHGDPPVIGSPSWQPIPAG
jgi:dipeptidyl aminopeptidase/acylaminoacyl peptidase